LNRYIWKNENEISNNYIDDDNNGYIDDYYGWNFIDDCAEINRNINEFSHGTHCAGIITSIVGNANIKIMVLPSVEKGGTAEEMGNVVNAIKYAERMGADICNLSCTFTEYSQELEDAIKYSRMYFVVAAGNFESNFIKGLDIDTYKRYPASFDLPNVITVGNMDINARLSPTSNYGINTVDIVAPGEWIYSAIPGNGYGFMSGTSMAAPMVTAVLALYYLYYDVDVSGAKDLLYQNAKYNKSLSDKIKNGNVLYFMN